MENILLFSEDGRIVTGVTDKTITHISIPSNVTKIGDEAFSNCQNLIDINFPDSMQSIGEGAFAGCSSLKNISFSRLEQDNYSFGDSVFDGCVNLESINLPYGLTRIPECTFRGCTALVEIDIPNTVVEIGDAAFVSCSSMKVIDIPCSVLSIGDVAFENCCSLNEVYLPDDIEVIGYGAFRNCSSIETLVIPKKTKIIGEYAFSGCSSLKTVEMPEYIQEINNLAFEGCISLENIYICSKNLFYIKQGLDIFKGVNKYKCVIHIPFGTHWLYRHDFLFKDFKCIETFSTITGNIIYKKTNKYLEKKGDSATVGQIAEYIIDKLDLDEEDSILFWECFVKNEESCVLYRDALKRGKRLERLEYEGFDLKRIIKLINELPDKGNGTCVLPQI